MSSSDPKVYRRYTNLAIAMDMLINKRLTIVGYEAWADVNDKYAMDLYKQGTADIAFLGAYCVAGSSSEAFHQWKVFADGPNGVCVCFDAAKFSEFFKKLPTENYTCRPVEYVAYRTSVDAQDEKLRTAFSEIRSKNIPFIKRKGFADEEEFRILYSSDDKSVKFHHIPFDLSMISQIILSPFLHDGLVETVQGVLKSIDGCPSRVRKARLTDNKKWQRSLARYAGAAGVPQHA